MLQCHCAMARPEQAMDVYPMRIAENFSSLDKLINQLPFLFSHAKDCTRWIRSPSHVGICNNTKPDTWVL